MTALAGAIWSPDDAPLSEAVARSMHAAMKFRSSTDVNIRRADVAFGHAHQPTPGALISASCGISLRDGESANVGQTREQTVWATIDGHITNLEAIRLRLQAAGYSLSSSDPADVLACLYEEEGTDAFARLRGAFAVAIWDSERRELTLARDPCGQRPMYYERRAGRMVFCSELTGLKPTLESRSLNAQALDEYLTYGYVPPPHTLLQGVSKVPPGTWVRLKDGRLDSGRFDALDLQYVLPGNRPDTPVPREFFGDHSGKQGGKLIELVQDCIEESVPEAQQYGTCPSYAAHDRPWEILHVAMGIRQIAEVDSEPKPEADTSVRGDPDFDWLDYFAALDEPIAQPAAATIFGAARKSAAVEAVLLTTYGGHALFACHKRHKQLITLSDKLPGWLNKFMGSDSRSLEEQAADVRARQRKYLQEVNVFGETDRANLYAAEHLTSLADADPEDFLHLAFDHVSKRDPVSRAALVDWQTLVPNTQVAAADWAANRYGCEIHHPYLNEDASRLLAAAPGNVKIALGETIWPSRHKASSNSASGGDFQLDDVPLASLNAILNDERFHTRSYLDSGYGEMLISATAASQMQPNLHRQAFALAALEVWMREMLD